MAYNEILPPKVGDVQAEMLYGQRYGEITPSGWMDRLSDNAKYVHEEWTGWNVKGAGELMNVGPVTVSNSTRPNTGFTPYLVPITFPTAGAIRAVFLVPNTGRTLHVMYQASVQVTVAAANSYALMGIKLDVLHNRQSSPVPTSTQIWAEPVQNSMLRWSNFIISSDRGITPVGGHFIFPNLNAGSYYRLTALMGIMTQNALNDTATFRVIADDTVVPSQFQFYYRLGG